MECARIITESNEKILLCENATLSVNTKGRKREEEKCTLRTDFQRDRDRIIHSKAFRRLKHKTQVFLAPESDHYRTRLTHTLEVSQIARTVARALRLNEDLTEAIALGHDLGHTPFGHAGERALNDLMPFDFTHFDQSVRVCEHLEKDGRGLNLTFEVLDGIKHHTRGEWAHTLEGKLVRFADRIAYINHDIDDAIRAGVISNDDIPKEIRDALGHTKTQRITTLLNSIVKNGSNDIVMDDDIFDYYNELHEFLYARVYHNHIAKAEEGKVLGIVDGIYEYFKAHPEKMGDEYQAILKTDGIDRAICDYIAGMTDHYAVTVYSNIFIPKGWSI